MARQEEMTKPTMSEVFQMIDAAIKYDPDATKVRKEFTSLILKVMKKESIK